MQTETISTKPNLQKRFLAGLVDYGIVACVAFVLSHFYGTPNDEGGYSLNGIPGFSLIMIWAIYIIGAEHIFGVTFGNYTQNLKAISIRNSNERDLTFGQSFKRHLVDVVDLWPFGILGILFIRNTKYNQRLGDLWAKTIVVDTTDKEQGIFYETAEHINK